MNKRYIDFVPVTSGTKGKPAARVKVGDFDGGVKTVSKTKVVSEMVQRAGDTGKTTKVSELTVSELFEEKVVKPQAGVTTGVRQNNSTVTVPRAKFVNTEKVAKRPLSKNVYTKQIVEPKEEIVTKPVKIIDKPEKDSKAGIVMAIIITIVLGAAVGTVAFLLLPK